jgi:hypothetical protein
MPVGVEEFIPTSTAIPVAYYDLQGRVIEKSELSRGIYVVRMSDGTARKIKRE